MGFFRQLRERRILPYVGAYILGGWGVLQFVAFLEARLLFSPHVVTLLGVAMILMLPSVFLLAWRHGRPGPDGWGRPEKISLPVNIIGVAVVLAMLFAGKDLGAVTRTVEVTDENGEISTREVPKGEYRRRLFVNYLDHAGDETDDWLREGFTEALVNDLFQDDFLQIQYGATALPAMQAAGYPSGRDLPRPLQRKLARDTHCTHFVVGDYARQDGGWRLTLELHESESGREVTSRTYAGTDVMELVDEASRGLRQDMEIPAGHLEAHQDLPIAEMLTENLEAYQQYVNGVTTALHGNDWQGAVAPMARAEELDPGFALASFMRYLVLASVGDMDGANAAMERAVANAYRLPERVQFQIKAIYYNNVQEDPDKGMAVMAMWCQLYPEDTAAFVMRATYRLIRNDVAGAVADLEQVLVIDPAQHQYHLQLARIHREQAQYAQARAHLERYAELYPSDANSFIELGRLHRHLGDFDAARTMLEKAQLLEPGRLGTSLDLASIDRQLGNIAAATEAYARAMDAATTVQDSMGVYRGLARLAETKGQPRQAIAALAHWNELAMRWQHPATVGAQYAMFLVWYTHSSTAEHVLQVVESLLPVLAPPNDKILGMTRAAAMVSLGRLDDAESGITETTAVIDQFKIEVLRPSVLVVAGNLAAARGDLAQAENQFRQGLASDPLALELGQRLAGVLIERGKLDEADERLKELRKRYPGEPLVLLQLARLNDARGHDGEARENLDLALAAWHDAEPDYPPAAEARILAERLGLLQ